MGKRATRHNGRKGKNGSFSAKHNDRDFDLSLAENIDAAKTKTNFYWNCIDRKFYSDRNKGQMKRFEEAEAQYLKKAFNRQWADTDYKYQRSGHSERCKSWEAWIKQDRNLPEETILQVGDVDEHATEKQITDVTICYLKKMNMWSKQHGDCFQILDVALHFDEATPHVHERKIWQYRNKDGVLCIGQEKALEQAGVPLPNPNAKPSRYNNRKMTFDKMAREMFLESCRECGLEVIEQPLEAVAHNRTKQQFIFDKIRDKEKALAEKEERLNQKEAEISRLEAQIRQEKEKQVEITKELQKSLKKANKDDLEVYKAYFRDRKFLQEDFKNFYMDFGEEPEETQLYNGYSF